MSPRQHLYFRRLLRVQDPLPNPCLNCGACCAFFRASFYWAEGDDATPGGVPIELTEQVNDLHRAMRGTNQVAPRCVALQGVVGVSVHCSIYEQRSSTCSDFAPSWHEGVHNERCDQARVAHGMAPLTPEVWDAPEEMPRVA